MQSSKIQEQAKDCVEKLISLDPVQFDAGINQYFEANAVFETPLMRLCGATRIKQFATFQSYILLASQIVSSPTYNEKTQIIYVTFKRTYKLLDVPLVGHREITIHYPTQLHLNSSAAESSDEATFLVTKAHHGRNEKLPLEHLLPLNLIRPIVTLIALIVCVITGFFLRHSFQKEGLVGLLISAYYEATAAIWLIVLGEKEKGMARVQKFNDDKDIDMSRMIDSAKTTATNAANQLETRAKDAGIPVDEYKQQAYGVIEEIGKRVGYVQDQVDSSVQDANERISEISNDLPTVKIPVEETKKQAYNAFERLGEEVGRVTNSREPEPLSMNEPFSDFSYDATTNDEAPTTPLGGRNSHAPHAFSYEQAASQ